MVRGDKHMVLIPINPTGQPPALLPYICTNLDKCTHNTYVTEFEESDCCPLKIIFYFFRDQSPSPIFTRDSFRWNISTISIELWFQNYSYPTCKVIISQDSVPWFLQIWTCTFQPWLVDIFHQKTFNLMELYLFLRIINFCFEDMKACSIQSANFKFCSQI